MDRFAAVCERVASYSSRLKKIALLADYFAGLDNADFVRAVRFLSGSPVPPGSGNVNLFGHEEGGKLSLGHATLRQACIAVTGWEQSIFSRCHEEVGDTGETISLLLAGHSAGEPLSLAAAEQLYAALYRARQTSLRVELLSEAFRTYSPLAIKYFVKTISGNFRIGLQSRMVEEAIAASCGVSHETVRAASNNAGDLAQVALAARTGRLEAMEVRLFHPMDFMLAKPLDDLAAIPNFTDYWVEDKYDGIRSQIHGNAGPVAIYSRGMEDVTAAYPELVAALASMPGSYILDGEILAWRDGRALPFTVLQQRLARKKVSVALQSEVPVIFMAYDLLYRDGALLLDRPWEERRSLLEQAVTPECSRILLSPRHSVDSHAAVEALFASAREAGNEGLILKRRGSLYEPGKRSGTWWKVKRPYATLDVVITAAEQGTGKRATVLSDYTFGVRSGEAFVNVGKAYSGLTDVEIRELTRLLRSAALEKFGRVTLVKPAVVLEVAFDGVQKSPRHKGGFALRFPRIVRWRQDKKPEDADTLERVRELYERTLYGA